MEEGNTSRNTVVSSAAEHRAHMRPGGRPGQKKKRTIRFMVSSPWYVAGSIVNLIVHLTITTVLVVLFSVNVLPDEQTLMPEIVKILLIVLFVPVCIVAGMIILNDILVIVLLSLFSKYFVVRLGEKFLLFTNESRLQESMRGGFETGGQNEYKCAISSVREVMTLPAVTTKQIATVVFSVLCVCAWPCMPFMMISMCCSQNVVVVDTDGNKRIVGRISLMKRNRLLRIVGEHLKQRQVENVEIQNVSGEESTPNKL